MVPEAQLSQKSLLIYLAKKKSPGACAAIEVVGTIFGFSGIGIIFAGRPALGIVAMLTYWGLLVCVVCSGGLLIFAVPIWILLTGVSAAQSATQSNAQLVADLASTENEIHDGPRL